MGIPDVDLDIVDRESIVELFPTAITASQLSSDKRKLVPHNTGLHFQCLRQDPINSLATFPYDIAEELGYYKIDFIPFHVYENIKNEKQLQRYVDIAESPKFNWDWFSQERFFNNDESKLRVTHIGNYYDLCQQYPPESVEDIAILIALIRPRKKYMIGEDWDVIKEFIWQKLPEEETDQAGNYFFKKSHAIGYALAVCVHMQVLDKLLS